MAALIIITQDSCMFLRQVNVNNVEAQQRPCPCSSKRSRNPTRGRFDSQVCWQSLESDCWGPAGDSRRINCRSVEQIKAYESGVKVDMLGVNQVLLLNFKIGKKSHFQ